MSFDPRNRSLKIQESSKTSIPNMGVHLSFDLCNRFLKIWEFTGTPTPNISQHRNSLGSVRVLSITLFALLGA
jgi:hypothetical protein